MRKVLVIFAIVLCVQMFDGNDIEKLRGEHHHLGRRKLREHEICELEKEMRRKVKCPEGQLPDQNGKCREIWIFSCKPCLEGYRPGENGKCSEVWSFNIITAPTYCPEGYQLYNGKCKRVF